MSWARHAGGGQRQAIPGAGLKLHAFAVEKAACDKHDLGAARHNARTVAWGSSFSAHTARIGLLCWNQNTARAQRQ